MLQSHDPDALLLLDIAYAKHYTASALTYEVTRYLSLKAKLEWIWNNTPCRCSSHVVIWSQSKHWRFRGYFGLWYRKGRKLNAKRTRLFRKDRGKQVRLPLVQNVVQHRPI